MEELESLGMGERKGKEKGHLEVGNLAPALPGCILLPLPHEAGGLQQNHTHKSLLACRGRQELSYWRWARTLFGGHCAFP